MPIKRYKTTRGARKQASIVDRSGLHRGQPQAALSRGSRRRSGRASTGQITVRHRGGGAKRLWRQIDFGQEKMNIPATVERLEYDPNRSSFIVLLRYADGDRRYRLAWAGAAVGDTVLTAENGPERLGNRLPLEAVTPGTSVFNVELKPGRGGQLLRAAGATAVVMDVQGLHAQLKLPSGEIRLIPKVAYATIGQAGNPDAWLERTGSAGRNRRRGRRPHVRGKAMNPVDHPHGGGEGSQSIGMKSPKTPWGKVALGVKTRPRRKYSNALIIARRQKKKRK